MTTNQMLPVGTNLSPGEAASHLQLCTRARKIPRAIQMRYSCFGLASLACHGFGSSAGGVLMTMVRYYRLGRPLRLLHIEQGCTPMVHHLHSRSMQRTDFYSGSLPTLSVHSRKILWSLEMTTVVCSFWHNTPLTQCGCLNFSNGSMSRDLY